jgi:uncharacterized 2Fe-2S/4Fe-4S cluster protein (DUF4445 family)
LAEVQVTFEPDGRRTSAHSGETVMDIAQRVGLPFRTECGGKGTCGKCRVRIKPSAGVSPLTSAEQSLLTPKQQQADLRLACQAQVNGKKNLAVTVPTATRSLRRRIQLDGLVRPMRLKPALQSILLRVPGIDPNESVPDTERVLTNLSQQPRFKSTTRWEYPLPVITKTPLAVRKARGEITLIIRNETQILDIIAGDARENVYGIALDIGTSKLVASLHSLVSGELIATEGIENPQLQFGEDIMSRLSYAAVSEETRNALQVAVIEGVNTILEALLSSGTPSNHIYEVVVVGNTVMSSLFLGLDTTHLAYGPFVPPFRGPIDVSASQVNLALPAQSIIHVLPNIAGYVGADAIADILATGLDKVQIPCLLIDIGTNSEVILGNKERILATSCAAGPAFEGAQIEQGMKAVSGAIERVSLDPTTLSFELTTIDNTDPIGLCGSGLVDAVAQLAKANLISAKGRFTKQAIPFTTEKGKNKRIALYKGSPKKGLPPITLSEHDISQMLLAKAAIQTGYTLLLQYQQLTSQDLGHIYIAGAFGTYLNSENAQHIGLIPPFPLENVSFIGNAALSGAQHALLSVPQRHKASVLAKSVEFVDLARHPDFSKTYAASLFL